jgi:hypothetical protein
MVLIFALYLVQSVQLLMSNWDESNKAGQGEEFSQSEAVT